LPQRDERIGERLLGDAVQDELHLAGQRREVVAQVLFDRGAGLLVQAVDQHRQRVHEAEFVQRFRPQPSGDTARFLQASPRRLADLAELRRDAVRRSPEHLLHLQQRRRQALPDLVVQLA